MTRHRGALLLLTLLGIGAAGVSGQDDTELEESAYIQELCKDKKPMEYFRLNISPSCRDVFQCTTAGLQSLICPHGLVFNLDLQTCDWRVNVKDCDLKVKAPKTKPLFSTVDPICSGVNELACGNGVCLDKNKFCDGVVDCDDKSDENYCDVEHDPNSAPYCDPTECKLPQCYCFNEPNQIPHGFAREEVPQMIMITFDDAINNNNIQLYNTIFNNQTHPKLNPNGCSIKSTFFIHHIYNNYTATQEMHRLGHEIGVHSITHNADPDYWDSANMTLWEKEMQGSRIIAERFANITDSSILGARNPFLRAGGNANFAMLERASFLYDSSMTAPLSKVPVWPYTLYYRMPHECYGHRQKCPTRSFAVWEMVINEMDRRSDTRSSAGNLPGCSTVDTCFSETPSKAEFKKFLDINFERHYLTNRAPMVLPLSASYIERFDSVREGLLEWIDEVTRNGDVYFVTMTNVIQWMQDPRPVSEINNYEAWKEKCNVPKVENFCNFNDCQLNTPGVTEGPFTMSTCMRCPNRFPWLNDFMGEGAPNV